MLCLTIARVLATFDVLPPVGRDGRPKIPEARYHNTFIRCVYILEMKRELIDRRVSCRHAMPFKCVVKPRSEKAVTLIHDAVTAHQ